MKRIKKSLVLNLLIVIFVILGCILMFNRIHFMPYEPLLQTDNISMFKFYTVDSNIFIGMVSLLLLVSEVKLLKDKIKKIPNYVYILKFIGTCCITLTFLVTLVFLVPQYGLYAMYNNASLIFHLIVPILSIISYLLFEKHYSKYKYALLALLPLFVYSIYYVTMVFLHTNNIEKYDFYGFLHGNINNAYFVIPIIFIIMYLISLLMLFINKKIFKDEV